MTFFAHGGISINNFAKNSQDFENIQFPRLHLEAENPFWLGCEKIGK